jgi:haloalkane dehalogenase
MTTQRTPDGIEFVRTPDARFERIEGFDYTPRFVEIEGLRMAYIDEGRLDERKLDERKLHGGRLDEASGASGHTILLPHGEPTWGYLYRFMIPPLVAAGHRVIVPDLIGFGRSDKPVDRSTYTYDSHVRWMKTFLDGLDLENVTVFSQDWGGLITLRIAGEEPDRFARIAAGNTGLPVGESLGDGFDFWLNLSQTADFLDCGELIGGTARNRKLSDAEKAAYSAPFPDEGYMAGVREFPCLVPITPGHASVTENQAAWKTLEKWNKPFLTLWGTADPVLGHLGQEFIDRIPGAKGQPHQSFENGGHFIQDDHGPEIASAINAWLEG